MTPVPAGTDRLTDALDGIRDTLSDLHRGPGTPEGEPLAECPGCEAQALVDLVRADVERLREYAAHKEGCGALVSVKRTVDPWPPCDCGLHDLLAAVSSSPATTETSET